MTTLHEDAATVLARMAELDLPPIGALNASDMRALRRARARPSPPGPAMASVEDLSIPTPGGHTLAARLYRPRTASAPVIVYFHGGGWTFGGIEPSDVPARQIAEATGCPLLSVDYRLAPEHPFPAATDDALAAALWALNRGAADLGGDGRVILMGESAGANLSAATALALAARPTPLAAQILLCPLVSADLQALARVDFTPPFLSAADVSWFLDQYASSPADRLDPRMSPALARDLSGTAPAFVATAEFDVLRFQGEDHARRLRDAGVPVTAHRYPGTFHGFVELANATAAAAALRRDLRTFIDALEGHVAG